MTDVLTSIQRILDKPDDEDCDGLLRDALRLSLLQHPDMEEDDQDTLYDCIWTLIGRNIESPEGEGEDAQILMTRLLWVVFPVLKPHAPRGSCGKSRSFVRPTISRLRRVISPNPPPLPASPPPRSGFSF
jgi:hypothetical protein